MRGARRWALRSVVGMAVIVFLGLAVGPRTGLYRTLTALSGSMRPTFAPGDVVVVRPEPMSALRRGQILMYSTPVGDHHVISHRVIEVAHIGGEAVVRTKGDANNTPDPWRAQLHGSQVWVTATVIPDAGWPILWLRTRLVRLCLLFGAPGLLVVAGLRRIWRPADAGPRDAPASV